MNKKISISEYKREGNMPRPKGMCEWGSCMNVAFYDHGDSGFDCAMCEECYDGEMNRDG